MNRKRKDEYIWVSKKFKNNEEDMVYFGGMSCILAIGILISIAKMDCLNSKLLINCFAVIGCFISSFIISLLIILFLVHLLTPIITLRLKRRR